MRYEKDMLVCFHELMNSPNVVHLPCPLAKVEIDEHAYNVYKVIGK
jgi:hypothetical protein